jgi:hypothetical protein
MEVERSGYHSNPRYETTPADQSVVQHVYAASQKKGGQLTLSRNCSYDDVE